MLNVFDTHDYDDDTDDDTDENTDDEGRRSISQQRPMIIWVWDSTTYDTTHTTTYNDSRLYMD